MRRKVSEETSSNSAPNRFQVEASYADLVDPSFAEALWSSGLNWLLRSVRVDGLVPRGALSTTWT